MPNLRDFILASAVAVLMSGSGAALAQQAGAKAASADARLLERGRYLIKITGCNDCHTPGYGESGGKLAESKWLTGDRLGWSGPWGTTYAINLRLYMKTLSEGEWIKAARTKEARPPMPWYALHAMHDQDLRAIYRFVKALGPAGEPAPAYLPPNQPPPQPYVQFPEPPKK